MVYVADLKTPKDDLKKDWVYDFLAELDDVFGPIQSNLPPMKPVLVIE